MQYNLKQRETESRTVNFICLFVCYDEFSCMEYMIINLLVLVALFSSERLSANVVGIIEISLGIQHALFTHAT